MKRVTITLITLTAIATTSPAMAGTKMVNALKGSELLSSTQVKLAAARSIALKARPGTVTDEELEKEAGGSGLRYSFDIRSGAKTYEVGVDARTGQLLENAAEGKNPD